MSLPQARLWAGLLMCLGWRFVADTHMRSSIIIEGDKLTDALSRFLYSLIDGFAIEFFRLDNAITTLLSRWKKVGRITKIGDNLWHQV